MKNTSSLTAAFLALMVVLSGASASAGESCEAVSFGAGVTRTETVPIADLLASAEARVGELVAVRGEVTEVCQMAGCWLELKAGDEGATIKVKVDDGVIVFPKWARGKPATAEGKVERLDLSREEYIIHREHDAHEGGGDFDASAVPDDGPFHVYRIRGTGAEICK